MEGMSNEMKNGLKLNLGDATRVTPRNIQEVQASKLGDAQGIPFFINKNSGFLPKHFIFIVSCTIVLFLEHLRFCFLCLVCLFCLNSLDPRSRCVVLQIRLLGVWKGVVSSCLISARGACIDCDLDFSMTC